MDERRTRLTAGFAAAAVFALSGPVAAQSGGSSLFPGGGAGGVCGDRAIIGEVIADIEGPGGCGVRRPVQVRSVAGVSLSPQPTVTCDAARSLRAWVERAAAPAFARRGARLEALDIAAHYICRGRNNASGGRLSEHARGGAIDISAFRLAGGEAVTVLDGWRSSAWGRALRGIHAAGCGPFTTTLGPGSDGYHEDHFHYDVERRRNGGAYCR